jgi:hypothetical protein
MDAGEAAKQRVRLANAVLNTESTFAAASGNSRTAAVTDIDTGRVDRQAAALEIEEAAIEDAYFKNKRSGIHVGMEALSQVMSTRNAPASPKGSKPPRGLMAAKPDSNATALDNFKNVVFGTKLNILLLFVPFAMVSHTFDLGDGRGSHSPTSQLNLSRF